MMEYSACIYQKNLAICKISYFESCETDFEYVFEPIYENIDQLENFRGIQGIDLSLRKAMYVRKNLMPTFLFEHNTLPGNKSFHISKKIEGMCLLEYLANTTKQYFGDKMYIASYGH